MILTPIALLFYRTRAIGDRARPGRRARHPRAEPLLEHGPLLLRRLHPAEDPLHGEVAALRQPDRRLHLPRRRRLPGDARPPRRGAVHHRARDLRARRLRADLRRGRALAHRGPRASRSRASAGSRSSPGVPVVPVAIHGSQGVRELEAAPLPEGHRPVRRADDFPGRRRALPASSSRRPPSRSSPRCARCTSALDEQGRRGVIRSLKSGIAGDGSPGAPSGAADSH